MRVITVAPDSAVLTIALGTPPLPSHPRVISRTVDVAGVARHYVLVVPRSSSSDGGRAFPLVLYFHGDGGDGSGMQRSAPFEVASGDTALVAYPDGLGRTWDLETPTDNRDVAFMEALILDVARDFSIDRQKVFAVG